MPFRMLSGAVLLAMLMASCVKDLTNVNTNNWNPEYATALLHTSATMNDFLDDIDSEGYLQINPDQSLDLVYHEMLAEEAGGQLIDIEDFSLPIIDTVQVVDPELVELEHKIVLVDIKSGKIHFTASSPYPEDLQVTWNLESLTLDNQAWQATRTLPANGMVQDSIDLNDFRLDFANDIVVRYIAFNSLGDRVYLPNVLLTFTDLEYKYIEGNFRDVTFEMSKDTTAITIFENRPNGDVYFEDPSMTLTAYNSFGIPMVIKSDTLYTEATAGNLDFVTPFVDGVNYNYVAPNQSPSVVTTETLINSSNSNIRDVFSTFPSNIVYAFSGELFPNNDTTTIGFAENTSSVRLELDLRIPLYGTATNFFVNDTVAFDADIIETGTSAEFKLIAENGFPIEASLQAYFLNEAGLVLDSLFTETAVLAAATVDADGRANSVNATEFFIPVSDAKLSNARSASKIHVKTSISTLDAGNALVRLYSDYEIGLKLGVKVAPL